MEWVSWKEMDRVAKRETRRMEAMTREKGFPFKDGINQLLSFIINTFYSSNGLVIKRILLKSPTKGIWHNSQFKPQHAPFPRIYIVPDEATNTLTIIDETGIGMTQADRRSIFYTITQSHTNKAIPVGPDFSIIGQFGARFYTAYLVNQRMVHTTNPNDEDTDKYMWECPAGGTFIVTTGTSGMTKMSLFLNKTWWETEKESQWMSLKDYLMRFETPDWDLDYGLAFKKEGEKYVFVKSLECKGYEVKVENSWCSATHERLTLYESEEEKKKKEALKEEFEGLRKVTEIVLGNKVEKVVVSDRVMDSHCRLVTGEHSWTLNMERNMERFMMSFLWREDELLLISREHRLTNWEHRLTDSSKKMVINPKNSIMKKLSKFADADKNDKLVPDLVLLLFELSLVTSGLTVDEPDTFRNMLYYIPKLALEDRLYVQEVGSSEEVTIAKRRKTMKTEDKLRFLSMTGRMSSKMNIEEFKKKRERLSGRMQLEFSKLKDSKSRNRVTLLRLLCNTPTACGGILSDPNSFGMRIHEILIVLLGICIVDTESDRDMPLVSLLRYSYCCDA